MAIFSGVRGGAFVDVTEQDQSGALSRRSILTILSLVVFSGLIIFSQTLASFGDEGFHLIAAELIRAGRKPYLDFFYQHPPLFPYLTAIGLTLFDSWRTPHLISAACTGMAIVLAADFAYTATPAPRRWRAIALAATAIFVLTQPHVIEFGTIAQPYGLCLLCSVAAFRFAAGARPERVRYAAFCAGLCAGAAIDTSLLNAAAAPVLLVWFAVKTPAGERRAACLLFILGTLVPCLPLLWFAAQSPFAVFFDIVRFQLSFRSPGPWTQGLLHQQLSVVSRLVDHGGVVIPGVLAAAALVLSAGLREARLQGQLYLCAAMMASLILPALSARPTFDQYFVPAYPFLGILAGIGLCLAGEGFTRFGDEAARKSRQAAPWVILAGVFVLWQVLLPGHKLVSEIHQPWSQYEAVGSIIDRVTPPNGLIYSDPLNPVFAAHRVPPAGLENDFAGLFNGAPETMARLHTVPQSRIDEWLETGHFDTVCFWTELAEHQRVDLKKIYPHSASVKDISIFWRESAH